VSDPSPFGPIVVNFCEKKPICLEKVNVQEKDIFFRIVVHLFAFFKNKTLEIYLIKEGNIKYIQTLPLYILRR